MDSTDCIVIGAGVIGLAVARGLAARGIETIILERADSIGTETSSRNSEVIHAGLYYPEGSLKSALCVQGRGLLYDYAARTGIPHRRCGKLIVATSAGQMTDLEKILARGRACGVHDLTMLSAREVTALEPQLSCVAGLLSPSTGIIDSHQFMLSLLGEAEARGTMLCLHTAMRAACPTPEGFLVETEGEGGGRFSLRSQLLVNAAGLWASEIAHAIDGLAPGKVPTTRFARGTYYSLAGGGTFSRLIYPVPEPGGLGVHLTIDTAGQMRFGPDVEWLDGIDYRINPARRSYFEREIRKYWPGLPEGKLEATYCGIRPKLSGPGEVAADFRIDGPEQHGVPGLINLYGIESPGLTSSLAIADYAIRLLGV